VNNIRLVDCEKGWLYRINSRNLSLGVFDGKGGFIGIREKLGARYLFTEYHEDTGPPYGTVTVLEKLRPFPETIPCEECLTHPLGASWATDPATERDRPVVRRDLREGENPHGKRQGFVDEWADTKERIPDVLYPYYKQNVDLFIWLDKA
jgi:hypothetical protein